MLVKILVVILLLVIFYCLGSGLVYLVKDREGDRVAKALTWRILLSLVLFVLLFIAFGLGLITPHSF